MKYVIFRWRSVFIPIMFPVHVAHSQIQIEEATPVSAGFFRLNAIGKAVAYGKSESLKLECDPKRDSYILNCALNNAGTSFFLTANFE